MQTNNITLAINSAIVAAAEKHADQYAQVTDKYLFAESEVDSLRDAQGFIVERITPQERRLLIARFEDTADEIIEKR
jgi:hypothetical protein